MEDIDDMPTPGRKPHQPTDITRAEVSALVSFGNTQTDIGNYLGIDEKTLSKYYRKELDTALMLANANVAKKLYNKAVVQDDLSAQVFWLKTRGRWRTADSELVNPQSVPEQFNEELKALVAKYQREV